MARYRDYQQGERFLDRADLNRRGDDLAFLMGRAGDPPPKRRFEPFWVEITDENSEGLYSGKRLQNDGKTATSPAITYTENLRNVNDVSDIKTGWRVLVIGRYHSGGETIYVFLDSAVTLNVITSVGIDTTTKEFWYKTTSVTVLEKGVESDRSVYHTGSECAP